MAIVADGPSVISLPCLITIIWWLTNRYVFCLWIVPSITSFTVFHWHSLCDYTAVYTVTQCEFVIQSFCSKLNCDFSEFVEYLRAIVGCQWTYGSTELLQAWLHLSYFLQNLTKCPWNILLWHSYTYLKMSTAYIVTIAEWITKCVNAPGAMSERGSIIPKTRHHRHVSSNMATHTQAEPIILGWCTHEPRQRERLLGNSECADVPHDSRWQAL